MKLTNANPNGCNVVINTVHPIVLFFINKKKEIEWNKKLQSLFFSREWRTTHKVELFITFISLMKMKWFNAFHVYINVENQL